jgi:hypothetical protein
LLVASFQRTFASFSVLINHFVPTIIARKRTALRVTAGVTCLGATPKARRQALFERLIERPGAPLMEGHDVLFGDV